jgi:hypothetical protein
LDIPYSLKYRELDGKKIYELNKRSTTKLLDVIARNTKIKDRVYYVIQFKTAELYNIWNQLIEEFDLNRKIQKRAIGGMVSLRKLTHIKFSPFTEVAYKCLLDYCLEYDDKNCFRLHFLGINLQVDRFHILFLEKLFKEYRPDCTIIFTYDSVGYIESARKSKDLPIYDLSDTNDIILYQSVDAVPKELIYKIYKDDVAVDFINKEIDRRRNNQQLMDINSFTPLSVYSNLKLDCFFEYIIDRYELIKCFQESFSLTYLNGKFKKITAELSKRYPSVFVQNFINIMCYNLENTAILHNWFMKTRNPKTLNYLINEVIKAIGCDDHLR